jgi:hypothetical protein
MEINNMNEINLEQLDTILTANNFTRVCANSWVYRATLCNVYLDIIKGECDLRFESTGNHFMAINYSVTLKQFDPNKLPSQVSTICDMLSDVSSRTVNEIKNVLAALT